MSGSVSASRRELDELGFRAALGTFVTGVSVATTVADGEWHGMTANAVTSVSLRPPIVLLCVAHSAIMAEMIVRGGVFALSFLADGQQALSVHFADPARQLGAAQFDGVATTTAVTGAPVLEGCAGWVECEVREVVDAGDHMVVLGDVVAVGADEDRPPLAYSRGRYGTVELHTAADGTPLPR